MPDHRAVILRERLKPLVRPRNPSDLIQIEPSGFVEATCVHFGHIGDKEIACSLSEFQRPCAVDKVDFAFAGLFIYRNIQYACWARFRTRVSEIFVGRKAAPYNDVWCRQG